jgi:hypothetical protein
MSKPIFIVRVPVRITDREDRAHLEHLGQQLQQKLRGYYVLTLAEHGNDAKEIKFECYNTTDLDTKSFEELKQLGTAMLNSISHREQSLVDMMQKDEDSGLYEEDETNTSI